MRICYIHLTRYPTRLANPVHVINMCAAMAKLGHDVTLVIRAAEGAPRGFERLLYGEYGVDESFKISVIPHHQLILRGLIQYRHLKRLLHECRPDLIYSRTTKLARAWTSAGIPYVFETHAMPRHNPRIGATRRAILSPNFRRLVVITRPLAEDLRAAFPELHPDSIMIAPDGANMARVRSRVGTSRFRAGYVGHLYRGKVMETIAAIAPRLPDICFHIVGGRPQDIEAWRERTAGFDNIRYEGHVPHREVGRHIAGFDLALVPFGHRVETQERETTRWCSPLKIFEYMAQGRTIVASDLPVLREVLHHGRNAWLVPPEDNEAWIDAIVKLQMDSELRKRLGTAALEDLKRNYTWIGRARRILADLPEIKFGPSDAGTGSRTVAG